jgi:hypothetical protein
VREAAEVQQWVAVLGTALGAVIGLGSAYLNDKVRWRREQLRDRLTVRRELYASYIAALTETHETMREASQDRTLPADARRDAVHRSFREGGAYASRYQIGIMADQKVLDAAETAFQRMRDIRDLLAVGTSTDSAEYKQARLQWGASLRGMQQAMREELGSSSVALRGGS